MKGTKLAKVSVDMKLETIAADLMAAGMTKAEAIAAFAEIWDREEPDDKGLRKLQASRLREARKLRGFESARCSNQIWVVQQVRVSRERYARNWARLPRVCCEIQGQSGLASWP